MGGPSYLSRIGVKQGTPIDGSVVPMFEGKADIDLNSIALSNEQVNDLLVMLNFSSFFYPRNNSVV